MRLMKVKRRERLKPCAECRVVGIRNPCRYAQCLQLLTVIVTSQKALTASANTDMYSRSFSYHQLIRSTSKWAFAGLVRSAVSTFDGVKLDIGVSSLEIPPKIIIIIENHPRAASTW